MTPRLPASPQRLAKAPGAEHATGLSASPKTPHPPFPDPVPNRLQPLRAALFPALPPLATSSPIRKYTPPAPGTPSPAIQIP